MVQGCGKLLGVDSRRDSLTDSAADGREDTNKSKHGSDVLMRRRSHGSHFLADNEGAAAESDEDLAHDDVTDSLVGLTEVDHQADAQDLETQHGDSEPFEAAHLAD